MNRRWLSGENPVRRLVPTRRWRALAAAGLLGSGLLGGWLVHHPALPAGAEAALGQQAEPSGAQATWGPPRAIEGAQGVTTTLVADLDGDGRDDVVALEGGKGAGGFKLLAWFEYTGRPETGFVQHDFDSRFPTWPFLGSAAAADLDADGDLDIVFSMDYHSGSREEGRIVWAENPRLDGTGSAADTWPMHTLWHFESRTEHINDMAVTDIDGDGLLDIVVRHLGDAQGDTRQVRILFQDDLATNRWTLKSLPVVPREGLAVGDLDEDSRVDLLLNGFWLRGPLQPRAGAWERHDIDATFYDQPDRGLNNATKNGLADLDGDGYLDAVLATAEGAKGKVSVYFGDGTPTNSGWHELTLEPDVSGFHQAELGDLDGDGDLDVMTGNGFGEGGIYVYYLDGRRFERQQVTAETGLYVGKLADLDGDGDLDIVGPTRYAGQLYWHENTSEMQGTSARGLQDGPRTAALRSGYPNPAASTLTFVVDVPFAAGRAFLDVYDALGRLVLAPVPVGEGAGQHVQLDISALPAGVYTARLSTSSGATAQALERRFVVTR